MPEANTTMRTAFTVNGDPVAVESDPRETLLYVLRERLGLTGAKEGCGRGECGTCTVLLDGKAVNACLVPIGQVAGQTVETVEGQSDGEGPGALARAFAQAGAVQCGFCTPGMIMAAKALLNEVDDPSDDQIRSALSGNLCRCTGYRPIFQAVKAAAKQLRAARGKAQGGAAS